MIRRPPRSTLSSSSAASDVYKRQAPPRTRFQRFFCKLMHNPPVVFFVCFNLSMKEHNSKFDKRRRSTVEETKCAYSVSSTYNQVPIISSLSLIHISEPTRL